VVVDATNVERHARRALVRRAVAAGAPAIAILFALPAETVLARNSSRVRRVVGQDIVERHLSLVAALTSETLAAEGFADVHTLRSAAEVAAVEVLGGPAG
jgi:predicted kinase